MKRIAVLVFLSILLYSCKKEEITPTKTKITPSTLAGSYYVVSRAYDSYYSDGSTNHSEYNYSTPSEKIIYSKVFINGIESEDNVKIIHEEDFDLNGTWAIMEEGNFIIDGEFYYLDWDHSQKTKCEIIGNTLLLTKNSNSAGNNFIQKIKLIKI